MDFNFSHKNSRSNLFPHLKLKFSKSHNAALPDRKLHPPCLMHRLALIVSIFAFALTAVAAHTKTVDHTVDRIVVVKSTRTMTLMHHDEVLKTYRVALGTAPVGAKQERGDHKTPEGDYIINAKNAHSQFHLALRISYPNDADRKRARKLGAPTGGDIMIHGLMPQYAWLGSRHRDTDWTDGCIAVSNAEIEEIWKLVPVGTRVTIKP